MKTWSRGAERLINVSMAAIALVCVAYHLTNTQYMLFAPLQHNNIHLAFALVITFLSTLRNTHKLWMLTLVLLLLSLVSTIYVAMLFNDLLLRQLTNTFMDLVIGAVLILLSLEATRRAFGPAIPIMASIFILYCVFGHLIPGPLRSMSLDWEGIISRLSIGLTDGIYGLILTVSASFVFLFMVFAGLVKALGALDFFIEIGKWVGRRFRAGPAMAAVFTSALVASITGVSGPNVMITGSFTIPAMKKVGYTPEQAGAIEAAASTSGPIMPPVMGVTAFIMAAFTGLRYSRIILVAFLPAVMYAFSAALYVYFQAGKMQVALRHERVDTKKLLSKAPLFFVPLAVIIILFTIGYSPGYVGFWACFTIVILALLRRKKNRLSVSDFIKGFVDGAELGARIGATCASIGLIVATISMSGLGIKLPLVLAHSFGDNLLLLLLLTGVVCIILGMGLPAPAAYSLVAVSIAPLLIKLGASLLPAHFFVFYLAVFSFITPPIATAALFGAQLAGANYMKTAFQAAIVGLGGFALPFMLIFCPCLTLDFSSGWLAVADLSACLIIFVGLQSAIIGYFRRQLTLIERFILFLSPASLLVYTYTKDLMFFSIGLAVIVFFVLWQLTEKRKYVNT